MIKTQKTILQVLPALDTGGVERGAIEMAVAIERAGGYPIVASQGGKLVTQLLRLGIRHITLPLASKSPWRIWCNRCALVDIIRRENVDLVHGRSRAPSWAAWQAALSCKTPFVATWHGVHEARSPFKKYYNSILTRGARVIAISTYIADRIRQEFGVGDDRLRTIHRGVDTELFNPEEFLGQRVQNLAQHFDIPPDAKVILMPGRLTRWKGQMFLIDALAELETDIPWRCVFVGPTETAEAYVKELEARIRSHNLQDRIRFAGKQDDMPAFYAMADVVVAPSLRPEPFGRVIIEAQAMGCPVIVSGHGGATETVIDKETGLIIPPGDLNALVHAITVMLGLDDDGRNWVKARARRNVLKKFSLSQMQHQTLAVYDEVLGTDLATTFLASVPKGAASALTLRQIKSRHGIKYPGALS